MADLISCPFCDGKGHIDCPFCEGHNFCHINFGGRPHRGATLPCSVCKQTGKVPSETREWVAAGKELRQKRQQAGFSLREFSRVVGISVVDLSYYESGRKPVPLDKQALIDMTLNSF